MDPDGLIGIKWEDGNRMPLGVGFPWPRSFHPTTNGGATLAEGPQQAQRDPSSQLPRRQKWTNIWEKNSFPLGYTPFSKRLIWSHLVCWNQTFGTFETFGGPFFWDSWAQNRRWVVHICSNRYICDKDSVPSFFGSLSKCCVSLLSPQLFSACCVISSPIPRSLQIPPRFGPAILIHHMFHQGFMWVVLQYYIYISIHIYIKVYTYKYIYICMGAARFPGPRNITQNE
jgi:hypothetical protein